MKSIDLVPLKRVGPFEFDSNISNYSDFNFQYYKCDDKTDWDSYILEDKDIEIYTEKDLIVSIACRSKLNYKGKNIIGMELNQFLKEYNLKIESDIDSIYVNHDGYQDVIDFDDIGIQIWIRENKIVAVFCNNMEGD